MSNVTDILIVGAGPAGLTMAIELQRRGITFRIIDKDIKPVLTSNALTIQPRTLDVWRDQGILESALKIGSRILTADMYVNDAQLLHLTLSHIESSHPFVLGLSQHQTETLLIQYLKEHNVNIEMEKTLTQCKVNKENSDITLQDAHGNIEHITAKWVIACDGAHSTLRTLLNIPFAGKDLPQHFVLADAKIESALSPHETYIFLSKAGPLLIIHFDQQKTRIVVEVSHEKDLDKAKNITKEQLEKLLDQRCPFALDINNLEWTSGFWVHEKMVSHYRDQTVFFVGDAAHVHSPAGGQGMNAGIQDAYNLAWKLSCVLKKQAQPFLIDTYHDERFPVAQRILRDTSALTYMISIQNKIGMVLRNIFLSFVSTFAFLRNAFVAKLTQTGLCYPSSNIIQSVRFSQQPKPGAHLPDVKYDETHSLLDTVCGTQHCLLLFMGRDYDFAAMSTLAQDIDAMYPQCFRFILINPTHHFRNWTYEKLVDAQYHLHKRFNINEPTFYLVRPDKYIAFCGKTAHPKALHAYLKSLFIPGSH